MLANFDRFGLLDDQVVMTACQEAVGDFFADREFGPPLHDIDRVGVYFRKE